MCRPPTGSFIHVSPSHWILLLALLCLLFLASLPSPSSTCRPPTRSFSSPRFAHSTLLPSSSFTCRPPTGSFIHMSPSHWIFLLALLALSRLPSSPSSTCRPPIRSFSLASSPCLIHSVSPHLYLLVYPHFPRFSPLDPSHTSSPSPSHLPFGSFPGFLLPHPRVTLPLYPYPRPSHLASPLASQFSLLDPSPPIPFTSGSFPGFPLPHPRVVLPLDPSPWPPRLASLAHLALPFTSHLP